MKKIYSFVLALAFSAAAISAQTFKKGDFVANVGIGLNTASLNHLMIVPPITGGLEYGILDNLCDGKAGVGVGGDVIFTRYDYTSRLSLRGKGSFHYEFVDKLDTYAGLSLGYLRYWGFIFNAHIGARYYFTKNVAGYAEIGGVGHFAGLEIGVAFKL